MRSATALWVACLAIGSAGCSRNTELIDDGTIPGLLSIEVTPADNVVVIDDLTSNARVNLAAIGHFEGGETRDVTGEVDWGVDNRAPGAFVAAGQWQSSNAAGGLVIAAAQAGTISGKVPIEVHFEPTLSDPSFPAPPLSGDLFDPATPVVIADADNSPSILYPSDQTLFPINLHRTLFQFDRGAVVDVVRIRFVAEYLDLKILTTGDRWQAEAETWGYLALTVAGGRAEMTVSGVEQAVADTVWQSAPVELHFSDSSVDGAIYFWSTSAEGIMKAVLSDAAPTRFYTQSPDTTCVACHTVSRDGTRMAVGYDGEVLQAVSVPDRDVVVGADRGYEMGWSTFSPNAKRLLLANKGQLRLIDADSGDPIGVNPLNLGGAKATHPDWSPLGDYVAVAICAGAGNNKDVDRCSIGRVPVSGDTFGAPEILVAAGSGGDNNYFPRYSPDGAWIAYVNADGKSKDQPKASLRLVPSAGGTPIELIVASSRVGPDDGILTTGSTMPTWAPTTQPGLQWLAFSSTRDYGVVLTGDKSDQLWVAGLDMERASNGQDPSFAAFWLPMQDSGQRNHRAFWAVDSAVECTSAVEVCDGYDNDCNGIVDDDCDACVAAEICFDGADNDCNGAVDDGCIQ